MNQKAAIELMRAHACCANCKELYEVLPGYGAYSCGNAVIQKMLENVVMGQTLIHNSICTLYEEQKIVKKDNIDYNI